jgi:AraC family transcriptional regulator
MDPVNKALWYIESHFVEPIGLDEVACAGGVSRYHMSRVFGVATGHSVMGYVRGRRLTEAARALANGAPDILTVALDVGYGSHEAFTRAFREQFGLTPEAFRAQGQLNHIELMEPIRMTQTLAEIEAPRFENGKILLIAGIGERCTCQSSAGIPAQWQRFLPHFGSVPGQVGRTAYGVSCNQDDEGNFGYICGVEVSDFSKVPADWSRLRIAPQKYAVFAHREHISTIRSTWNTVWNKWLPESGYEVADAPDFERYGEEFDPRTGTGGLEIWIPVKR